MIHLALQNTYEVFELGLYQGSVHLDMRTDDKKTISKNLIPLLNDVLTDNNISLDQVEFISVNQGPGPFTTLRSVIASVNGLNFGAHIPLIGIDGLKALLQEYPNDNYPITIALLNAFSKDVYFGIQNDATVTTGYKNIFEFLQELKQIFKTAPIRFIGSGTQLYKNEIVKLFGSQAYISDPLPQSCSLDQIARMGLNRWEKQKDISKELYPLYLKTNTVKPIIRK